MILVYSPNGLNTFLEPMEDIKHKILKYFKKGQIFLFSFAPQNVISRAAANSIQSQNFHCIPIEENYESRHLAVKYAQ